MSELSYPKSEIEILLTENIHGSAVERLKSEGFSVRHIGSALSEDQLLEEATNCHILGIRSKTQLTEKFFAASKRLMAVGCYCIGTNQVELVSAQQRGIPVFNAPFSNTRSVAEMIIAEIVMLSRKLGDRNLQMHSGRWEKSAKGSREIREKTLGIVGYGHIGSQVSVVAEAMGMQVLYYDIVTKMQMGNSHQTASLNELLENSDFVTLHVPETPQTKNMFGAKEIRKMKPGSYLLNASRGSVIDISALKDALESGHLNGAAIDVFPTEPKSNQDDFVSELRNLPNTILTPHIGGSTEEAQFNIGLEVSASITKFINNGSSTGAVNFPQVDIPQIDQAHRILNVHKNQPGVLSEINKIISDVGANIAAQQLSTLPEIGYLIMDLDKNVSNEVKDRMAKLPASIRTRILY